MPVSPRDDARVLRLVDEVARVGGRAPRSRLAVLARAAFAAVEVGDLARAEEASRRWQELLADAHEAYVRDARPAVVSDALLMAQSQLQLDDYPAAGRTWSLVLELTDAAGDATGRRRAAAHRGLAAVSALAGVGYTPVTHDPIEEIAADARRACDVVLVAVTRAMRQLDEGDPEGAVVTLRAAVELVRRPAHWPVLLVVYLTTLVAAGARTELEMAYRRHVVSPEWERRQDGPAWTGRTAAVIGVIGRGVVGVLDGRPANGRVRPASHLDRLTPAIAAVLGLRDPSTVPPAGRPVDGSAAARDLRPPRVRATELQVDAILALRRGEEPVALEALVRSVVEGERPLVPFGLAYADPAEIARLCQLVAALPPTPATEVILRARSFAGVDRRDGTAVTLSEREHEILALIRRERSNPEIARELYVTVNTVKFHRTNLYRKLGASTREELLAAAVRHGI